MCCMILRRNILPNRKNDPNLILIVHKGYITTLKYWKSDLSEYPSVAELHDPGHMKKTMQKDLMNIAIIFIILYSCQYTKE